MPCWLDDPVWVTKARGSAVDNQRYCSKAQTDRRYGIELGVYKNYGQGKDPELMEVKGKLDGGVSIAAVYQEHFEISSRNFRFFKEYRDVTAVERTWYCDIEYVFGPSGSGKTKFILERYPPGDQVYWLTLPKNNAKQVWWDNYSGQETVVIDDWYPGYFGDGHVAFMMRLVDNVPLSVPVHGGQTKFRSKRIVFSSNCPPERMDKKEYSGYDWNEQNPLFSRIYLREKPWTITQIGQYKKGDKYYVEPREPTVLLRRQNAVVIKRERVTIDLTGDEEHIELQPVRRRARFLDEDSDEDSYVRTTYNPRRDK